MVSKEFQELREGAGGGVVAAEDRSSGKGLDRPAQ